MESRGSDERIKFVGPTISVRWRENTCVPGIYVNDHITLNLLIYLQVTFLITATKRTLRICLVGRKESKEIEIERVRDGK